MPVIYSTPEPFAPYLSSAYGAAEQFSKDAPSIIGANQQANSLLSSNQQQANDLRFRYAAANSDSLNQQADRYFRSDAANADRQQQGYDLGAQLDQRSREATAEMQGQAERQRQGADLSAWLSQQELNQKDVSELGKMKAAISEVQASNLTPEQKQDAIFQLRTKIDPLDQRLKASQARAMEQHGQLYQMQLEQEAQKTQMMAKVNNMTAAERIHYEVPPEAADQIEQAVNQLPLTPQQRDQQIKRLKRMHPNAQQFVIEPDGKLTPVKKEPAEKPVQFDMKAAETAATIEAEAAHPPARDELSGKETPNKDFYRYKFEVMNRLQREHDAMNGVQRPMVPSPTQQTAQPQGATVAPTPEQQNLPFTPGDTKSMTPYQQEAIGKLSQTLRDVQERTDLPAERKTEVVDALHGLHALTAKYGILTSPKLAEDKADRERLERYAETIRKIPPRPEPTYEEKLQRQRQEHNDAVRNNLNKIRGILPRLGQVQPGDPLPSPTS